MNIVEDKRVSLDVRNLCHELNVVPYWDVGVEFGVQPHILRSIQASSGPGSTEQQWKAEMFQYCLDNECIRTWSDVAHALQRMNRPKLANKIRQIAGLPQSENAEAQLSGNENSLENQAAMELEEENVFEIKSRFSTLLMFTCSKLEQNNTNAEKFHLFLATFFSVTAHCIPSSGDIGSMFKAMSLNNLWDCLNWRPLKAVIENFLPDDGEAEAKVREYSESLAAYKATTKISKFIKNQRGLLENDAQPPPRKRARYDPSYYRTFEVKLNVCPTDLMLKYIDKLWEAVCIQFSLPPLAVLLDRVEGNSISITWLFPTPLKEQIIKISSHSEEFFQKNNITAVYVDDQCVYTSVECSSTSTNLRCPTSSKKMATPSESDIDDSPAETTTKYTGVSVSHVGVTKGEQTAEPSAHPVQDQAYDCEFIEPPPKSFQTECPVCLRILRKPHEVDCCGTAFCQNCISQVPVCPTCREKKFTVHHSKHLERSLRNLHVRCENHKHGCKWTGELGQYDSHINPNSQLPNGCAYAEIECATSDVKPKLTTLKEEVHPVIPDVEESVVIPIQRTIFNFTEKQKFNQDYVSEPFYTHPGGYKMCLWVFPNGYGDAEKKYASVFTCFMKGENDDELQWPFRGSFTVRLIDQVHNKDHKDSVICYDDKASSWAQRVRVGEKSQGWGIHELISLEFLRDPSCQYLKNDCLKIQIIKVDIDTAPPKTCKFM